VPSGRPGGLRWRAAPYPGLRPPAGSGGRTSVLRRRPSLARGPRALARRSAPTCDRVCSPPSASLGPGRWGARPRMARPPPRPSRRRCAPRSPTCGRSRGCTRARRLPWRPPPAGPPPLSPPAGTPWAAPADLPPPVPGGGSLPRPWPTTRGRRAAGGPRHHRPSTGRGPFIQWPRAASPAMGSPRGPWWATPGARSNGGRRPWRGRARRETRRERRRDARRPSRRRAVRRMLRPPPRCGRRRARSTRWR
jgi:hypothetical protein